MEKFNKRNTYGKETALNIASRREAEAINILKSSNKLNDYAFTISALLVILYIGWFLLWNYYFVSFSDICYVSKIHPLSSMDPLSCPYRDIMFNLKSFETVCYTTSGVFASLIFIYLIQLIEADLRASYRLYAVYSTLLINAVAFFTHYSMARGWFPIVISTWGRISHLARWGEWLCTAPALMVMLHSINIKSKKDLNLLYQSSMCQTISVLFGSIASFTRNKLLTIFLLTVAISLTGHIYYVAYYKYQSYLELLSINNSNKMKLFKNSKINKESNNLRRNMISSGSASPYESKPTTPSRRNSGTELVDAKNKEDSNKSTRQIIEEFEMIGAILSIKLTIYCAVAWTSKLIVFGLGVSELISNTTESILQTLLDCISKGLITRLLCSNHMNSLNPDEMLSRMLHLEEQANSSIRQFLRFVFHEVAAPLGKVTSSLNGLNDLKLSADVTDITKLAREECSNINQTLTDLLNFQEAEDGKLVLKSNPLSIKDLITNISQSFNKKARDKGLLAFNIIDMISMFSGFLQGVKFFRSVDNRIPDYIMGEKMRLTKALIILIQHALENTNNEIYLSGQLINKDDLFADVRITIRFDSDDNVDDIDELFKPYNNLSTGSQTTSKSLGMSLCVAKQNIELHGGDLSTDISIHGRVSFICNIPFSIPTAEMLENFCNYSSFVSPMLSKNVFFQNTPKSSIKNEATLNLLNQTSQKLKIDSVLNNNQISEDNSLKKVEPTESISQKSITTTLTDDPLPKSITGLIVDDSVPFRKVFKRSLEKLGVLVDIATDGDELVSQIINETGIYRSYDIIFLDNNMPNMNGVDAIKILRENHYDGIVIGVTGNVLKEDIDEFKSAGCNDVLSKPIDQNILKKIIISYGFQV